MSTRFKLLLISTHVLDGIFPTADVFSAFFVNVFKRTIKISSQYKILIYIRA